MVLFYKTSYYQGELQSSDEGEVWWEEIDNLPNLSLSLDMNDNQLITNAGKPLWSESPQNSQAVTNEIQIHSA